MAGFDKLPVLAGAALKLVRVNAGATALESTNLIDGISIGSVTPAAGAFTTLSASGNVSLGDAVADTLSVGGNTVKNATGNWSFAAPSSGATLAISQVDATNGVTFNAPTDTRVAVLVNGTQYGLIQALVNDFRVSAVGASGAFAVHTNGASRLSINSTGNVTIATPNSGATLALTVLASTDGVTWSDGTVSGKLGTIAATSVFFGTGSNHGLQIRTNNADRVSLTNAGNVTINAPSSGATLALAATAAGVAQTFTDGTVSGAVRFDATTFAIGSTSNHTLALWSNAAARITVTGAGNVTLNAPSSGAALTINPPGGGGSVLTFPTASSSIDFTSSAASVSQLNWYGATNFEFVSRNASAGWVFYYGNAAGAALSIASTGYATFGRGASTATNTIAFSATPTVDARLSNVHEIGALTGNITTLTVSNPTAGQTISVRVKQDATGGRTVAAPSGAKISGSVSGTANAASILTITYSAADARWEGSWLQLPA